MTRKAAEAWEAQAIEGARGVWWELMRANEGAREPSPGEKAEKGRLARRMNEEEEGEEESRRARKAGKKEGRKALT